MANSKPFKSVIVLIIVVVVAVMAWGVLTVPDQRSTGQKVGDAIDALPQGVDKAARQLEDRTPGEKLGDAVKDTGENIRRNTDNK
jgi:short subunit fatty acids transporter